MNRINFTFLLFFIACNPETQQGGPHIDNKADSNSVSSISIADGQFKIDTAVILENKNLQTLIDKLEETELSKKKTVAEIPMFIKSFLDGLTYNFSIADPGESWQAGCISPVEADSSTEMKTVDPKTGDTLITVKLKSKKLPSRQLIYFGSGKDIALLTYYTGGIGKSVHILIIKFAGDKITDFWCGNILSDINDKDEILQFLNDNKDKKWGLNTNIIYF